MSKVVKCVSKCRDVVTEEQDMEWEIFGYSSASSSFNKEQFFYQSHYLMPKQVVRSVEGSIGGQKWFVEATIEQTWNSFHWQFHHVVKFKFFVADSGKSLNTCYQFVVNQNEKSFVIRNNSGRECLLESDPNDPLLLLGSKLNEDDFYTFKIRCIKMAFDADTALKSTIVPLACISDDILGKFSCHSSDISILHDGTNTTENESQMYQEEEVILASFFDAPGDKIEPVKIKETETLAAQNDDSRAEIETLRQDSESLRNDSKLSNHTEPSTSSSNTLGFSTDGSFTSQNTEETSDEEEKFMPGQRTKNADIVKRIRKVYLAKMRQVAETSSRLMVTAARVSRSSTYPRCSASLNFFSLTSMSFFRNPANHLPLS